MKIILTLALSVVLLVSCNVAQQTSLKDAAACDKAADCAGKGLTKGPCEGGWACNAGACEWSCTGATAAGWCGKPADCESQGLGRPGCDGLWTCEQNICGFACGGGGGSSDGGSNGLDGGAAQGCLSDADCPSGYACVSDPSQGFGTCQGKSDCTCPASWAPVCGVNGETWPNRGCAACAGGEIAYDGECRFCPAPEAAAAPCDDGVFERVEDATGCPLGLQCVACGCATGGPIVCGSDGVTYASACHASCAGAAVASGGACPATCAADAACPPDSICAVQGSCPANAACAPRCEPVPACLADADCGAPVKDCGCGAACVAGTCYDLCWQCNGGGPACATDADCENAGLPRQDCRSGTGAWLCMSAICEWSCAPGIGECMSEYDPATGTTCTTCVDQQGNVNRKCG